MDKFDKLLNVIIEIAKMINEVGYDNLEDPDVRAALKQEIIDSLTP